MTILSHVAVFPVLDQNRQFLHRSSGLKSLAIVFYGKGKSLFASVNERMDLKKLILFGAYFHIPVDIPFV